MNISPPSLSYTQPSASRLEQSGNAALPKLDQPGSDLPAGNTLHNFVVFEGDKQGLIMPQSEKTDRMSALLARVDKAAAAKLVDSGYLDNDKFLDLAEKLSDAELGQLADTLKGLQTPPKLSATPFSHPGYRHLADNLLEQLGQMPTDLRQRSLALAAEYARGVAPSDEASLYTKNGLLSFSASANDLHNFVLAIGNSTDPEQLLGQLETIDVELRSDFLQLAGSNADAAGRLLQGLEGYSRNNREQLLGELAEMSRQRSGLFQQVARASDSEDWAGAVLGYDDRSAQAFDTLLENAADLLSRYRFSDQQLDDMNQQFAGLQTGAKRAYIALSLEGLSTLVGGDKDLAGAEAVDLSERTEVLTVLDNVRNSKEIQQLVQRSRMGEARFDEGREYLAFKDLSDANSDQQIMIRSLVSDAWLNREDSDRPHHLAAQFRKLEASSRDEFLQQLAPYTQLPGEVEGGLADLSPQVAELLMEPFRQRLDAFSHSSDPERLLALEASLPESEHNPMWKVAQLFQEKIDGLMQVLENAEPEGALALLEKLEEQFDNNKQQ